MNSSITLEEFAGRVAGAVNGAPGLRNVWVTAETSDVRRSAHCYLELVQKHPDTGEPVARMRATIWRNVMARLDGEFTAATGAPLRSGIKVMVLVTASFHPAYGLSVNITGIDPTYTMGDLMRRRMEILARLKAEGVIDLNRELEWPEPALRIAVVSAPGAAGYGDFVNQLYGNPSRLRFVTRLFPALMQGNQAADSIIAALERIAMEEDEWDCVVIIRGGGATADLAAFENYELAANIAQFPLPIIIGIGHERDVTVLDYVANMRVKTPTAAAEWLVSRGEEALGHLDTIAATIVQTVTATLGGCREQLAYMTATLPHLPSAALASARTRTDRLSMAIGDAAGRRLQPERTRLERAMTSLSLVARAPIERQRTRLQAMEEMAAVLSPAATLRRGYSITRVDGHAVTSAAAIPPGATLVTTLADGTVKSTVG